MGSKAREGAKAMSLAFVVLDFQYAGVRKRKKKSVPNATEYGSVAGQRGKQYQNHL